MVYRVITVLAICSLMVSAMAQGNQKHHKSGYVAGPAFGGTPAPAAVLPFVAGMIRTIRRKRA